MSGLLTVDLDKDGIMEIPGEYEMPASEFMNVAEGMLPVAIGRNYYHCLQDGTVSLVSADFLDPAKRYNLDLLQLGLYGRVCMVFDYITEDTAFYLYDSVNTERGAHLFTLHIKDVNGEPGVFFDISTDGKEIGLTPDSILQAITMIETEVT